MLRHLFVNRFNRDFDSEYLLHVLSPPLFGGCCLPTPFFRRCRRLLFSLKLDFHALEHEGANKTRLAHHFIRGQSRPLKDVMEQPRFSASYNQFFTVSL